MNLMDLQAWLPLIKKSVDQIVKAFEREIEFEQD